MLRFLNETKFKKCKMINFHFFVENLLKENNIGNQFGRIQTDELRK